MGHMNLDSKKPGGPPQSATIVGWDHHLIIKGFSCTNRPDAVSFNVGEFLHKLYNGQGLAPLKYGYHTITENAGEGIGMTLQLSFAVEDGTTISIDAALRSFCHKFFNASDHSVCQQLSTFGMYGFSPQEEKIKYFWYEAMFKWMGSYRVEKLADIEANLAAARSSGTLGSWIPSWTGGLLFALSLGGTWAATRMFGPPVAQEIHPEIIGTIHNIMIDVARDKSQSAYDTARSARTQCMMIVNIMERVVTTLNETPTNDRPQMVLHRDATMHLIGLFESGYGAVTVCVDAVLAFQKARELHAMNLLYATVRSATTGLNFIALAEVAEIPQVTVWTSGFSFLFSVGQMIFSAGKTYETEQQRQKWDKVAVFVAASMRIAQGCEYYLRWTYNSGVSNGEHTSQYYNELRDLMQDMGASEPLPEDCTPEAIRARLVQCADTLNVQKEKLIDSLT
ncbi:hypothetical protein EDB81DRAFT_802068 [Dactylonectria macrodidyma]|uniref:Uncharacterized protein n=1 Tax=Dactylonectria macrodidyma TaxID=307937 RepID=A0A9P9EFZ6_9HYPO|nr:hypothetical protein EDB81DRAFT_802068 [Dactylonectria macrodidyma]